MAKRKGLLQAACDLVTADPESSRRHWTQVKEAAVRGAKDLAWPLRQRERYAVEADVAQAALDLIERTGKGPKSLVLGEAKAELGFL